MATKANRSDKEQTRELILDAAERVFGESGYKGAATRLIALEAGVNETTLFRHFPSKDNLFLSVIQKNMEEARQLIDNEDWESGNLQQDMTKFARFYLEHLRRHEPIIRVCITAFKQMPPEALEMFHVNSLPTTKRLSEYLEREQAQGRVVASVDCRHVSQAFLSILLMAVLKSSVTNQMCFNMDDYVVTIVTLFVRGLEPAH